MRLNKIEDPRSPLEKIRRKDLENFCVEKEIPGAELGMPAILMRVLIRQAGFNNIPKRQYPLGGKKPEQEGDVSQTSAEESLAAQWKARQTQGTEQRTDYAMMKMPDVRKAVTAKGLKWFPKDTKKKLIERLEGKEHEDVS